MFYNAFVIILYYSSFKSLKAGLNRTYVDVWNKSGVLYECVYVCVILNEVKIYSGGYQLKV